MFGNTATGGAILLPFRVSPTVAYRLVRICTGERASRAHDVSPPVT